VLHESMEKELAPIRARAREIAGQPKKMAEALETGAERARTVARQTMAEVKTKMGLA